MLCLFLIRILTRPRYSLNTPLYWDITFTPKWLFAAGCKLNFCWQSPFRNLYSAHIGTDILYELTWRTACFLCVAGIIILLYLWYSNPRFFDNYCNYQLFWSLWTLNTQQPTVRLIQLCLHYCNLVCSDTLYIMMMFCPIMIWHFFSWFSITLFKSFEFLIN